MKWFAVILIVTSLSQARGSDSAELESMLQNERPETVQQVREFLADDSGTPAEATVLTLTERVYGASCSALIGSCEYYLCRESLNPCGEKGYYLAFGHKYCSLSLNDLSFRLSPKGRAWLTAVSTCLQVKLEREISPGLDCREIRNQAIASHESCYETTNFCSLQIKDVLKVIRMLSPELTKFKMVFLGLRIIKNCII